VKIGHNFDHIIADSSLGIILVGTLNRAEYQGFWICSQSPYSFLYHFNESFEHIYVSKDHIVVKDPAFIYWLLSFQHSFTPKESIQLLNKTKLFEGSVHDYCLFESPFISFLNFTNIYTPVLIDVLSGKDLLKENNIEIPDGFSSRSLTREYFTIERPKDDRSYEIWIFQLSNLTKPPLKILTPEYPSVFFDGNMYFVAFKLDEKETRIDCYFHNSGKKTSAFIPFSHHVDSINMNVVCSRKIKEFKIDWLLKNKSIEIYLWNSDYTSLTLWKSIDNLHVHILDCFHSCLSLVALWSFQENSFTKISIYSKSRKQVSEISLPEGFSRLIGDQKSRIYSRCVVNNEFYLCVFDFAN